MSGTEPATRLTSLGGASSCSLHDMLESELRGIPTAYITAAGVEGDEFDESVAEAVPQVVAILMGGKV